MGKDIIFAQEPPTSVSVLAGPDAYSVESFVALFPKEEKPRVKRTEIALTSFAIKKLALYLDNKADSEPMTPTDAFVKQVLFHLAYKQHCCMISLTALSETTKVKITP